MYFQFFIQTHAYVIQVFLLCLQDLYFKSDTDRCHQNQTEHFQYLILLIYSFIFMQQDFIQCTINSRIIIFLPVKFISWCNIVTTVLSRYRINILRTKVYQDLEFILLMPRAMCETGFGLTCWVV